MTGINCLSELICAVLQRKFGTVLVGRSGPSRFDAWVVEGGTPSHLDHTGSFSCKFCLRATYSYVTIL